MVYRTESKLQGWRALAIFEDGNECLIYLGRSTTQVRNGYAAAYEEVLTDEERAQVRSISLQCWQGAPDEGKWIAKTTLRIPSAEPVAVNGKPIDPRILPFRGMSSAVENADSVPVDEDEEQRCIAPTG
jgi:hypothetical protein